MLRFRTMLRSVKAHPVWGAVAFASLSLVGLWAFVPQVAQAGSALENALIQVVGFIVGFFVSILGAILIKFIGILVAVAQFNNFIDAPAVKVGWSVTRDISNMFFIVALLLIAVGTMFRIDQYRYSRTLQKLIMMAILINFSKAIAGFFIDFSQVVMLTFVNAFKDQAAGSLSAGFGIDKLLTISSNVSAAGGEIETLSVLGSLVASLIMVFVATVVVAIFTILLIQRIIMLWIYIVLAPTAYMVAVLPGSLGSWWSSWWRDFSQYLIKGPVIAFFLWLALTIITLSTTTLIPTTSTIEQSADLQKETFEKPAFVNEATSGTAIINYLVAIGMLIAGLQQAAKSSGAAGAIAGKWMGNFNKWGSAIATSPLKGARGIGGFAGRRAADLVKPTAYSVGEGALGVASKMNFFGIGAAARKQQANLRQQRLKAQDKDVSSAKFLDAKGERQILLGSAATLSGQGYQKAAMENAMKTHGLKGYSDEEKMQILSRYEKHIGYSKTPKPGSPGEFVEGAIDSDGLRARKDLFKKSPGLLALRHDRAAEGSDEQKFYATKMTDMAKSMGTAEINDMEIGDWKNPTWQKYAVPEFNKRMQTKPDADGKTKESEFAKKFDRDVGANMQEAFFKAQEELASPAAESTTEGDTGTRAQEDIDRQRQERTAARVAAYQQRNLNFHESDEYLKNQGQFYDQQSYATNLAQEERRGKRETDKERGAFMPVTGASTFAKGTDNTLAVDEDTLNEAGVRLTAAGTVSDPQEKENLAKVLSEKLATDIADVEAQLANTAPEILDSVQAGSGTGTTARQAMERQLQILQGTQKRLQDPSQLGSLKFINADRFGGNVRNAKAEEDFHEKLQEMDPDGSFREQLRQSMSPEELQKITADMRAIPGQENIDEKRAFEEHLAKGLTNLTRETWADTGPNAVKLSSGLALQVQRQAEAKNVKMHKLTLLQQQANVQVPSRFATVGAGTRAMARNAAAKAGDIASGTMKKVGGIASKVSSGVSGAASTVIDGTKKVVSTVASTAADYAVSGAKKVGEVSTAPIRAGQRYLGKQAAEKAEEKRTEIPVGQLGVKVTQEGLKAKRQELNAFERQTQQETDDLARQYQEQKQVMDTSKNRLVGKTAAEKMDGIRKTMAAKAKALKEKRSGVQDYEVMLKNSEESLGKNVGGAYRKGERADQYMAAGQGLKPKPVAPQTPPPVTPSANSAAAQPAPKSTPAAPASAAPTSAPATPTRSAVPSRGAAEAPDVVVTDAEAAPNVTNITNVTQNITNAFKAAPADIRGKLQAINSEALDSALKNSIVWRGLMSYIKNNTAEVQKSEKLGDVGREELQKRIGKLQNHMDEGNAEAFKNEFGELQSIFSGNGGGNESTPET